ncbi:Long-chain-fatty-acid--CoA ligase FadD17 [Candidatus Entotheonellaceae bacterium PAL068K]
MAKLRYVQLIGKYLKLLLFKKETIGRSAENMAVKRKNAPCLYFEADQYTFDDFNRGANRRANLFRSLGLSRGDVVCLMMENRPEFLQTLVGLSKLGVVISAINYNQRGQALVHSVNLSQARKAIVGRECLEAFAEAMEREPTMMNPEDVFVDTRWEGEGQPLEGVQDLNQLLSAASDANPPHIPLKSDALLMYIFTSGTTGLPKAAKVTHLRLFSAAIGLGWYGLGVGPRDTIYCALPLYHSNGVLIAFGSAMFNGAALALSRRFSASRFWQEVHQYGATCFIYIGEVLRYLYNTPPGPYDRDHKVERILGNGLRSDIWAGFQSRFGIRHIREFYASTEGNAATLNLNDVPGSVGTIILKFSNNLSLVRFDVEREDFIRDQRGFCIPCDTGEVGALLGEIKSTTPFHGYTNARETENKLLRHVFKQGDAFFNTGDLLKQDEAGNYYFIDRIGDTFRWKGENVSTHEVAEILSNYPGVALANVYGVQVPGAEGRVGMVALSFETDNRFDPQTFYAFTEQHLPIYARPAFVRLQQELAVTGTFKLQKNQLQTAGYNPAQVSDPLYFRDRITSTYVKVNEELFAQIQEGAVQV